MLGRKEHAAVFIGQDRRFVCADFPCRVDDFFFVESDEGTQKRAGREVFGNVQIGDRLACNLFETFAGDDAVRVRPLCDEICRFHHAHAEHERRPRLGCFFFDAHLHVGKGNVLLGWFNVGWAYFYTKKPVHTPADLKTQKLSVAGIGLPQLSDAFKAAGFRTEDISPDKLLQNLKTDRRAHV